MTLRHAAGTTVAEDTTDLLSWLRALAGCPPVTEAVLLSCPGPTHEDGPATWCFVEADAAAGVARRRCLGCGLVYPLLDSDEHWTYPPMWSCLGCSQSIAEVGLGLNVDDAGLVRWLAVGVRCVTCGRLAGVSDLNVAGLPADALTG